MSQATDFPEQRGANSSTSFLPLRGTYRVFPTKSDDLVQIDLQTVPEYDRDEQQPAYKLMPGAMATHGSEPVRDTSGNSPHDRGDVALSACGPNMEPATSVMAAISQIS